MSTFNTAAQITTALTKVLKMASESDLAPYYTDEGGLIDQSLAAANAEVVGRLLARGFRYAEDVLLWDRAAELEKDICLYWCLLRGGAYGSVDPLALKSLDRRAELDTILVTVNNVWVQPASGQPGTITTSGPRAGDASGVFDWDATDETDRGIVW